MGSCIDLRKYQKPEAIQEAYSKIVSGNKSYKAVIERKKILPKCVNCFRGGEDGQKFCVQCGGKMALPITNCSGCKKEVDEQDKFCQECGLKLKD